MEVKTPFVIKDLPDQAWSVSWPGYEYVLVNNENKAKHLLEILFETVKVNEAQLALRREGWSEEKTEIMHVGVGAWWQDPTGLSRHLAEFIVTGIKFNELVEAEHFKQHMDQRLMWRRLGGAWQ